jgi:hypothetical protein
LKTIQTVLAIFAVITALQGAVFALPLEVTPVELYDSRNPKNSIGALEWRGGFALNAADKRFGGISSIQISRNGKTLMALSDRGAWARLLLSHNNGRLTGVKLNRIGLIEMPKGEKRRKFKSDAEASTTFGNQTLLIAFEGINRILAYNFSNFSFKGLPKIFKSPKGFKSMPGTGGPEAMTRLCDGRLLVLSEQGKFDDTAHLGWLKTPLAWSRIGYRPRTGYVPTSAAVLPDCRILVVERRFYLLNFSWRMAVVSPHDIRPNHIAIGKQIALFRHPAITENFEAIAARNGKNGEILIYVMSDDNFSVFQQTYLLLFALKPNLKDR